MLRNRITKKHLAPIYLLLTYFICNVICFVTNAQSQIQLPLQSPSSIANANSTSSQHITARVIIVSLEPQGVVNDTSSISSLLDELGTKANLILEELGTGNFVNTFDEEKEIIPGETKELIYNVSNSSKFKIKVLEFEPNTQSISLESYLETLVNGSLLNVVKASGKVKVGEYLLYKNLEFDNALHHLILIISSKDKNDQDKNDEHNDKNEKENSNKGDDSNMSQPEGENKKEEDISQETEGEQKNDNKQQSDKNIMLLLQSLEDVDKQEQKEMLNQREKIELPERWW